MKYDIALYLFGGILTLAEIFCVVATFSPHWIKRTHSSIQQLYLSFGFLMECNAIKCVYRVEHLLGPIKVRVSFSFMVVSCFLFVVSNLLWILRVRLQDKFYLILAGASSISASIFALIAVSIYTAITRADIRRFVFFHYDYCFALAWCAVILGLIAGSLTLYKSFQEKQTSD